MLGMIFGREPIVLMYHRFSNVRQFGRVDAESFERQLSFLARHCNVISLRQLAGGIAENRIWPASTVVVTIDDGYADVADIAVPLLKKHRLPATVFVTTDFIDGRMWYWQDKLRYIVKSAQSRLAWGNGESARIAAPRTERERRETWNDLADHCYRLSPTQRIEELERLASIANVQIPEQPSPEFAGLSWGQLRSMVADGIAIAAHGVTHERLSQLAPDALNHEVMQCRLTIEDRLQISVETFAYPYGGPEESGDSIRQAVRDAGYKTGFVSFFDAKLFSDPIAIRRFGVGADYWDFLKAADGLKRVKCLQQTRTNAAAIRAGVIH